MKSTSDSLLVQQAKKGNKQAFNTLVYKYQNKIARLIAFHVKDPNIVPDLIQESFIKAFIAVVNFNNQCAFYTWLYRIATNTAKNYLLTQQHQPNVVGIELNIASDYYPSPEQLQASNELRSMLYITIKNLPKELKSVLIMREIMGYNYETIAQNMHCPVGTVRSRLFRARGVIEKQIQPFLQQ